MYETSLGRRKPESDKAWCHHKKCVFVFMLVALCVSRSFAVQSASDIENCITNSGTNCFPFTMNVSSGVNYFSIRLGAAGTFFIDCGAEAALVGPYTAPIYSSSVYVGPVGTTGNRSRFWKIVQYKPAELGGNVFPNGVEYTCNYGASTSGLTVGLAGSVGEGENVQGNYYDNATTPTFAVGASDGDSIKSYLSGISGSLGQIFPALSSADIDKPNFYHAFYGCQNLTSVPSELFQGVSGSLVSITPKQNGMFRGTFQNCTGLTGNISTALFSEITGNDLNAMTDIFSGDTGLATTCAEGDKIDASFVNDYPWANYTSQWITTSGNTAAACDVPTGPEYKFFVTTTNEASGFDFSWKMSAKGTFYVDCGDATATLVYPDSSTSTGGGTIARTGTSTQTYTCSYPSGGVRTISFGGQATGYSSASDWYNCGNPQKIPVAIGFNVTPLLVARISGSLGAIFPTIGNSAYNTPVFYQAFSGCKNLTGTIPPRLFEGVTRINHCQFMRLFVGDTNLVGPIPENLFRGITGDRTFQTWFYTFGSTNIGRDYVGGPSKYYIPNNLFDSGIGASSQTIGGGTFYETGILQCCPAGMRKMKTSDISYSMAEYVSNLGNYVSCIPGTPEPSEKKLLAGGVCVDDCGKKLKVSDGQEYPLYNPKPTTKALGVKSYSIKNGANCYVPLGNGAGSLNINDGVMIYHALTETEIVE